MKVITSGMGDSTSALLLAAGKNSGGYLVAMPQAQLDEYLRKTSAENLSLNERESLMLSIGKLRAKGLLIKEFR